MILFFIMIPFYCNMVHAQINSSNLNSLKPQEVSQETQGTPETAGNPIDSSEPMSLEKVLELRDPFTSFQDEMNLSAEMSMLPDLEKFAADKFKLIGVIVGTKKNKAMLVAPNGKMIIVSENAKIGLRKGIVKKIIVDHVIVEEKVKNILGQDEKIISKITLNKEKPL